MPILRETHEILLVILVAFLVFTACSGYEDDPVEVSPNEDGDSDEEMELDLGEDAPDDFPLGPYGVSLGSTMANFKFNDCDGNEVELKDFYRSATAILINRSAGWCPVCRNETPTLNDWYGELSDDGLVIIQVLFENNSGGDATESFCRSWRDEFGLDYYVIVETGGHFIDYHPSIQAGSLSYGTPLNIILNRYMRIKFLIEGDIPRSIYDNILATMEDE